MRIVDLGGQILLCWDAGGLRTWIPSVQDCSCSHLCLRKSVTAPKHSLCGEKRRGRGRHLWLEGGKKIWVRHRVDNADTYESPWEHKLHPIPPQPDFLLPKAEASNNRGQYAWAREKGADRETLYRLKKSKMEGEYPPQVCIFCYTLA